ncbi:MAG: DEAD/DEAH box helicase [Acidobacteriota bacterium]
MGALTNPLEPFHPIVRSWFADEIGTPTEVQRLAWPRIATGEHVLVSAPTGSGKTLTAFLWALDRLFTGAWPAGAVRVLYVSPLRALNTDIRRNLEGPLEALVRRFAAHDPATPTIRVATRSGDTPTAERRKMLRRPPEILVTTPESLNILLTSQSGRRLLGDLRAVILDEIHAVVGSKRGVHLLTAIERLVDLSGEFQRIALSATVRPMETVAAMVGALAPGVGGAATPRPVRVVQSREAKRYDVRVAFPLASLADAEREALDEDPRGARDGGDDGVWHALVDDFRRRVERNRSTLLFANSRRTTEKVTRFLNDGERGSELAYSHHGSLSRAVRQEVERRLKDGELRAIVATSSLELGIDVGALDEVLLVQTPPSIAAAIQRIGRAGHGVGEESRGVFYPTHGADLLEAAVVARAVVEQEIEELRPVEAPLDVLAQVLLSMIVAEEWSLDELFDAIRTTWAYRRLPRRHFDLVLDMLAGRYADTRLRELRPRMLIDRVRGTVKARAGVERMLYMAGGTIADRGYFALRHKDTMAKIGELDEEFVWERSVGDAFTLGAQTWQIQRITHNDVLVTPGRGAGGLAPFWRADARDRGFHVCQRTAAFLEVAAPRLRSADFAEELRSVHRLEPAAVDELKRVLEEQKAATGGKLPRRDRLLVERCRSKDGARDAVELAIVHTFWGGAVNRPLAMALEAAWEEQFDTPPRIFHDDWCLLVGLPDGVDAAEIFSLVPPDQVEMLLRSKLENTGFFGARFRVAAQAALLLPRAGFRQRTPLWLHRQRAKKLLEAVSEAGDFPIVLETWRTCLRDEFDLVNLKHRLEAVRSGALSLEEVRTESPSPFAANLMWQYTNKYMYDDDTPEMPASHLRTDVLQELVHASHLRPRLPRALVERFDAKARRLAPGYAPPPGDELVLWLAERVVVSDDEWLRLLAAIERDHGVDRGEIVASVEDRALRLRPALGVHQDEPSVGVVVAAEVVPRLEAAYGASIDAWSPRALDALATGAAQPPSAELGARLAALRELETRSRDARGEAPEAVAALVAEWLRSTGPVALERVGVVWGLDDAALEAVRETLVADGAVVDRLRVDARGDEICDPQNLEILLRWLRAEQRPQLEALDAAELPLFLALHQGLVPRGDGVDGLEERLERLFGWPAPAEQWEMEILPARLEPYYPAWLDAALAQSDLLWLGLEPRARGGMLTFGFRDDLELFVEPTPSTGSGSSDDGSSDEGTSDDGISVDPADDDPADDELADETASPRPWPGSEASTATGAGTSDGLAGDEDPAARLAALFPGGRGRFELDELAAQTGLGLAETHRQLWSLAWRGLVTTESFLAVRRGVASRFEAPASAADAPPAAESARGTARARRGRRRARWRPEAPRLGLWTPVDGALDRVQEPAPRDDDASVDLLASEELTKDRVRLLLERWGVLCRELVARELPTFRWARVFRTLRIMELSGEVLAGHFFHGIRGLQFATPAAYRQLVRGLPHDAVWWQVATDPASLCGVDIEGLRGTLPSRRPSTHLVYHGRDLVVVSRRRGRALEVRVPPEHPRLLDYFDVFRHLLTREVGPLSSILVDTVTTASGDAAEDERVEEPAARSEVVRRLESLFRVTREGASVRLWRSYR